jgi:hypothetical protein
MKKIFKGTYVATLGWLLLLTACSKNFTDKSPSDSIPIDQALNTEMGIKDALNGLYSTLRSPSLYGRDFLVLGDLQADNTYVEIQNSGRYIPQYAYNVVVTDDVAEEMWRLAYNGILKANQIIDANVTSGDTTQIAQTKAQAYAIRALLYFKLVNIFATPYTDDPNALGVPLVLTYDPYSLPKRNTVKEVYDQAVSDLQQALKDAPGYVNSVYLSRYAMEALLAKIYFYQGDNNNAKTAAEEVINNSGFSLVSASDYNAFWEDASIKADKVEVMFEVDADVINNNGDADISAIYINTYQDLYASSQLYDLYSATDIRRSLLIPGTTKSGAPAYIVNKFPNSLNKDRDNLKVIRLSEVYLIAAEASLPNDEQARKYLNDLMAQRDPGFVYASSGAQLLNDIINERRKELAFEGDRFYDLNRLKLPVERAENPGAIPAGPGNVNLSVPYPDYRRIAPLPLAEIQANPNMASQQNPGY